MRRIIKTFLNLPPVKVAYYRILPQDTAPRGRGSNSFEAPDLSLIPGIQPSLIPTASGRTKILSIGEPTAQRPGVNVIIIVSSSQSLMGNNIKIRVLHILDI
jgi:hypothetical protein